MIRSPHTGLLVAISAVFSVAFFGASTSPARSAPTAEVAKKCLRYAYRVFPYKRPGAAKASNGRQLYFNECLGKNGDIQEPPLARQ